MADKDRYGKSITTDSSGKTDISEFSEVELQSYINGLCAADRVPMKASETLRAYAYGLRDCTGHTNES